MALEQDPYLVRQILDGRRFERAAVAVLKGPDGMEPPEWASDMVWPVVEALHKRELAARQAAESVQVAHDEESIDGADDGGTADPDYREGHGEP